MYPPHGLKTQEVGLFRKKINAGIMFRSTLIFSELATEYNINLEFSCKKLQLMQHHHQSTKKVRWQTVNSQNAAMEGSKSCSSG
jgi:hypothetical protein